MFTKYLINDIEICNNNDTIISTRITYRVGNSNTYLSSATHNNYYILDFEGGNEIYKTCIARKINICRDCFSISHNKNGQALLNFFTSVYNTVPRMQFEINCLCCREKTEWVSDCQLKK